MGTVPDLWQLDIMIEGQKLRTYEGALTRREAITKAVEMNGKLVASVAYDWMPYTTVVAVREDPDRQVARDLLEDLESLEAAVEPQTVTMQKVHQPKVYEIPGHWVEVQGGMGSTFKGFVVSASGGPNILIENASGERLMLNLNGVVAMSEDTVDLDLLRKTRQLKEE